MVWYEATHDEFRDFYVNGDTELHAKRLIERLRGKAGYELTVLRNFDLQERVDSPEGPMQAIEETENNKIRMSERRVNQAGSKGVYTMVYDR